MTTNPNPEAIATVRELFKMMRGTGLINFLNGSGWAHQQIAEHFPKCEQALDTLSAAQVVKYIDISNPAQMPEVFSKAADKFDENIVEPQVPEKCAIGWGEAKHYGPPDSMGICHPIENSTAPQVSGDVETCKICNKKCEPLAANPMLWPVRLLGKEGTTDCYHQGCIATERAELERWKKEAMQVMNDMDLQAIGKELGLTIGDNIAPKILPALKSMATASDRLREALKWIVDYELTSQASSDPNWKTSYCNIVVKAQQALAAQPEVVK